MVYAIIGAQEGQSLDKYLLHRYAMLFAQHVWSVIQLCDLLAPRMQCMVDKKEKSIHRRHNGHALAHTLVIPTPLLLLVGTLFNPAQLTFGQSYMRICHVHSKME